MLHILQNKLSAKLDPLALKCMPNLHNILNGGKIIITKTQFELESNSNKNKHWMKEVWHLIVYSSKMTEFNIRSHEDLNHYFLSLAIAKH